MLNRVTDLFIGKDIDRSAGVADGEAIVGFADGANALAEGEVVVLDKNLEIMSVATSAYGTNDTIYIAQGTANTYDVGSLTGVREIRISNPIEGGKVRAYKAESFTTKAEQTSSLTLTGLSVVAGTEYIVRLVYKDLIEHPGQFTHTYRHIATAADAAALDTFGASIAAKINAHSGRRS